MENDTNVTTIEKEQAKEEIIEKISGTIPRTTIEMLEQTLQIA